jgi:hypothetical protein
MLKRFDPAMPCMVEINASDIITAAVLFQIDNNGVLRPVAFMSKKMSPAICKYDIYYKELLAIL